MKKEWIIKFHNHVSINLNLNIEAFVVPKLIFQNEIFYPQISKDG